MPSSGQTQSCVQTTKVLQRACQTGFQLAPELYYESPSELERGHFSNLRMCPLTQLQRLAVLLVAPFPVVLAILQLARRSRIPLQKLSLRLLLVARVVLPKRRGSQIQKDQAKAEEEGMASA